jgi:hypothetical protein
MLTAKPWKQGMLAVSEWKGAGSRRREKAQKILLDKKVLSIRAAARPG